MAIKYPKVRGKDVFRAFWQGMKHNVPSFLFVLFGVLIFSVGSVISPLLYKKFIDIVVSAKNPAAAVPSLVSVLITILILGAINWVGYRLAGFMTVRNQVKVIARIRQNCYEYILKHSYGFFSDNFAGAITQRVSRMTRAYERITDRFFWSILPLGIQLAGIAFVLWRINPVLGSCSCGLRYSRSSNTEFRSTSFPMTQKRRRRIPK